MYILIQMNYSCQSIYVYRIRIYAHAKSYIGCTNLCLSTDAFHTSLGILCQPQWAVDRRSQPIRWRNLSSMALKTFWSWRRRVQMCVLKFDRRWHEMLLDYHNYHNLLYRNYNSIMHRHPDDIMWPWRYPTMSWLFLATTNFTRIDVWTQAFFHHAAFSSGGKELVCDLQARESTTESGFLFLISRMRFSWINT